MGKTTVYLPTELSLAIKAISRRTGRSQAAIIREALQDYVDRQEPPHLLSLGIVTEDIGLQAADVEAWLAANWRPDEEWGREPPGECRVNGDPNDNEQVAAPRHECEDGRHGDDHARIAR